MQVVLTGTPDDDDDEDLYILNVVIGIEATKKFPSKTLLKNERRNSSTVSWPSFLPDVLKRSRDLAKPKTKLTVDSFRGTHSMLPPILSENCSY